MEDNKKTILGVGILLLATSLVYITHHLLLSRKEEDEKQKKLKRNLYKIKSLYIYPIKSCKGISITHNMLNDTGLLYDRKYMLINENNKFITARPESEPKIIQIETKIINENLIITFPDTANLPNVVIHIGNETTLPDLVKVTIWNDQCDAKVVTNNSCNEILSKYFHKNVRLVMLASPRYIKKLQLDDSNTVSFADAHPVLVATTSSLNYINNIVKRGFPIDEETFRPNIIIDTEDVPEWVEDNWKDLTFPSAKVTVVKKCTRCPFPTLNPETLRFSAEPLKTLQEIHADEGGNPLFGVDAIPNYGGELKVGDSVTVSFKE